MSGDVSGRRGPRREEDADGSAKDAGGAAQGGGYGLESRRVGGGTLPDPLSGARPTQISSHAG